MFEFIKNLHINLIYIICAFIGVAGAWGIAVWHRRNKKRDAQKSTEIMLEKEFSQAKDEFISAFDDSLSNLKLHKKRAEGILFEPMRHHEIAFQRFRNVVRVFKGDTAVSELDKVWTDYYSSDNPQRKYKIQDSDSEGLRNARLLAIEKIQAIVDFVNEL